MTCAACIKRGQTWNGSQPVCAFDDWEHNWNCATLNAIRDLVYEGQREMPAGVAYAYCDDQKYATVNVWEVEPVNALTLWVSWYKSRGGTDALWLLEEYGEPRRPTEQDCLAILVHYKRSAP